MQASCSAYQPKNYTTVPPEVRNYFLDSSPSATFIIDLPQVPQKRSSNDVDKGTMAKKLASSKEEKQQPKTMTEEHRSGSRQEPPSSIFPDQLSHEPSSFNNLKCLDQADHIPRIPAEVRNHLIESSPSATSIVGLSRVLT
ncbi:hypothetical protein OSB04_011978 [Centaurea solstitialis]|uniref:Uncharacterized protein n=1 Tax=Centaurea solstitialis TaxID=347529 RepID=A0AA38TC85_9ASTR|nr:hypothetical protein OSB04_011978 [Centaurea solstitialis]